MTIVTVISQCASLHCIGYFTAGPNKFRILPHSQALVLITPSRFLHGTLISLSDACAMGYVEAFVSHSDLALGDTQTHGCHFQPSHTQAPVSFPGLICRNQTIHVTSMPSLCFLLPCLPCVTPRPSVCYFQTLTVPSLLAVTSRVCVVSQTARSVTQSVCCTCNTGEMAVIGPEALLVLMRLVLQS